MKQKIHRDPVCGKRINRQKAHILIKHKGYGYFLCCPLCQQEFELNPDRYAKPEYALKLSANKKSRRIQIRK